MVCVYVMAMLGRPQGLTEYSFQIHKILSLRAETFYHKTQSQQGKLQEENPHHNTSNV